MKAAQIDVVERTTQLLAGFNLSTAAPKLEAPILILR